VVGVFFYDVEAMQRTTILCDLWAEDNYLTKIAHSKKFASIEIFAHLGSANNIVLLAKTIMTTTQTHSWLWWWNYSHSHLAA